MCVSQVCATSVYVYSLLLYCCTAKRFFFGLSALLLVVPVQGGWTMYVGLSHCTTNKKQRMAALNIRFVTHLSSIDCGVQGLQRDDGETQFLPLLYIVACLLRIYLRPSFLYDTINVYYSCSMQYCMYVYKIISTYTSSSPVLSRLWSREIKRCCCHFTQHIINEFHGEKARTLYEVYIYHVLCNNI